MITKESDSDIKIENYLERIENLKGLSNDDSIEEEESIEVLKLLHDLMEEFLSFIRSI